MKTWGLVQRKSLTVPCSVTDFDWSNIANEWCASAELAVSIAAMTMRLEFSTLLICSSTDPELHFFLSKKARRYALSREAVLLKLSCPFRSFRFHVV